MTSFVLDPSTVLAWMFRDARAAEADMVMARVVLEGAAAPRLMALEVPNGLRDRRRRGIQAAKAVGSRVVP